MAKKTTARLVIEDLSKGRNGYDPPWAIKDTECVDAVNVDWYQSRFAHKRLGSLAIATTFSAGGPFTGNISFLFRHVPGTNDTLAELWAVDDAATPVVGRMAGATTFAAPTLKDAITSTAWTISGASINGKLALAYGSAVARMHGWDGSTVRRFGLAATVAPTAADGGGGGAYAAVLRYYRQRSTRQSGGVTIGRSEPSPSVSFTPSGANANATVTQAAVINEGETHWEVEASIDGITFYRIATVVIGTTTYADTAVTTTYNTNPLSATTGTYTLQKPYLFVGADQNRLLGFGSRTATDKQNRLEISAVIGSLDVGDEERVDTTTNYYVDFDELDSSSPTGLAGPILGSFLAFKIRQTHLLTPTGQTAQPFTAKALSKSIGSLTQRSVVTGEDRSGNPCLYWMSHRGPYRWGLNGLEYIGRGIEDLILGPTSTISITSDLTRSAQTLYFPDKRQVWFWFATGGQSDVTTLCVFDVVAGGWSRTTGANAVARCSCLFANTLGATMSTDLKPYFAQTNGVNRIWKGDTTDTDNGTLFQAYVTTKAYEVGGPGYKGEVGDPILVASPSNNVVGSDTTITMNVIPDFGVETSKNSTALLTPATTETRVIRRFQDASLNGFQFYQWKIGDTNALQQAWSFDRLTIPIAAHESMS